MLMCEESTFSELRHVRAKVVDPDLLRVALVLLAAGEKEHVGLDALRIEDASWQSENRVQVALVHQIGADLLARVALEKYVVGKDYCGTAARLQSSIDML